MKNKTKITTEALDQLFTDGAMQFVKLPVTIEAIETPFECVIPTLEGDHLAILGDYIIKGVSGEYYPCKPDIFKKTYVANSCYRYGGAWVCSSDGRAFVRDAVLKTLGIPD